MPLLPPNRHIIHIHIPAFSIAVERVCCPGLRERPVVVAPLHSDRAVILSASSEARQEGIFKGMPLGRAVKFYPGLIVLPPNPSLTERASKVLIKKASQYTPLWEPARPGHIYMDLTGTERLWGQAKDTANRLSREIKGDFRLAGTVGVAGNKMVSSIASRILPSEGILDVDHGRESFFLAPLKVDFLPGVGHVRKRALLEELNITLVREIAEMDICNLKMIFRKETRVIHERALGIDPTPVYPPRVKPSVSEEITLQQDENDDEKLLGFLYCLVEKCAKRLRNRSLIPGRAGLLFRYADQVEVKRRVKLPCESFWDFDLYRPFEEEFIKACGRRVRVRYMRVWFQDLSSRSRQLSLFPPGSHREAKKQKQVIKALDKIRDRYGGEKIAAGRGTQGAFLLNRRMTNKKCRM